MSKLHTSFNLISYALGFLKMCKYINIYYSALLLLLLLQFPVLKKQAVDS